MKKLLTLSFVALFVVALSTLSFAQPALNAGGAVQGEAVVVQDEGQSCCGPVMPGCYAPFRPFYRAYCAPGCYPACVTPRPVCAPQCDLGGDPCAYPAVGYRTPVRSFLGRVFTPRVYYAAPYCY